VSTAASIATSLAAASAGGGVGGEHATSEANSDDATIERQLPFVRKQKETPRARSNMTRPFLAVTSVIVGGVRTSGQARLGAATAISVRSV
jgi:hypothetical protein